MLSVIIPASNEAGYIGKCLDAILASETAPGVPFAGWQLIVVANGCKDATAEIAGSYVALAAARDVTMVVLDIEKGNKLNALNVGDREAQGDCRAYIDADVVVSPQLLFQLNEALDRQEPVYASGWMHISRAESAVTRAYARIWTRLPFTTESVTGAGVFSVNAAGRKRWESFPQIIADDIFVRLQFTPEERIGVPASYEMPLAEGFKNLLRVRRRQDNGSAEIAATYPEIMKNEIRTQPSAPLLVKLVVTDFVGFCVYVAIRVLGRLPARTNATAWTRGR